MRALFLFFAQILGSIAASGLIVGLFPAAANVRTTLSSGLSIPKGLFIEAFLTAELVFTILMLAKEKHKATFIAPVGIGMLPSSFLFLFLFLLLFPSSPPLSPPSFLPKVSKLTM